MRKICLFALLLAVALGWTSGATAEPKGKLVVGIAAEPRSWDPHRTVGFPQLQTFPYVFDSLVFRDHTGKLIPYLAKSWRLAKPTVWEFKLREGIKFSNGEPVDAQAVKYSLERMLDPKTQARNATLFRSIDYVEVVDKYTAWVHTKYTDTVLPSLLTHYMPIVPPKYYSSHDFDYLAEHPVGSGPYRLVRWKKGEELVFEAKNDYWQPGVSRIKTGILKVIPEPITRVSALVAGDVDLVQFVPPQLVPMIEANPQLEAVSGAGNKHCYIIMITKEGAPWADVRVRKALNYAVDKEGIIKNIMQGHASVLATNIGPASYGYNPNLKPYPYKPGLAKKLLAEAGLAKGFDVDMYVPIGRYMMGKEASEAIAGQLSKVGVNVRVRAVEWGTIVKRTKVRWEPHSKPFWWYSCRNDLPLHAEGMYAGAVRSSSLFGGFPNKEMDALMEDARSEPDAAKRHQKYMELNRLIQQEYVPLVFLYQLGQIMGKKKNVDYQLRALETFLLQYAGWKNGKN